MEFPVLLRKAAQAVARPMSEMSLHGGHERTLRHWEGEALITLDNPRYWRCQSYEIPAKESC